MTDAKTQLGAAARLAQTLRDEVAKVMVGQKTAVEQVVTALLAGGHCLVEGLPGLGKTTLVTTLASALSLDYRRIQFTPDLMPSDITGTDVLVQGERGGQISFQKGPVFTNVLLADEINRGTPRTQSALLEVMQEGTVTVMGRTHKLDQPFFVMATQNPIELEGTYPLPEAQLDRFLLKVNMAMEGEKELLEILSRFSGAGVPAPNAVASREDLLKARGLVRDVVVPEPVGAFIVRLVAYGAPGNSKAPAAVARFVKYGPSPRGAISLALAAKARALSLGRPNVEIQDVKAVALPALRHRIILNFEGEAGKVRIEEVVDGIVDAAAKQ